MTKLHIKELIIKLNVIILLIINNSFCLPNTTNVTTIIATNRKAFNPNAIPINKCCEKFELLVDERCTNVNETNTGLWVPVFTGYNGEDNIQVPEFRYVIGKPACGRKQMWPIYHYFDSVDKLMLLPNGKLRHYIKNSDDDDDFHLNNKNNDKNDDKKQLLYDYDQGHYCMDKAIKTTGLKQQAQFAMVCSPEKKIEWTDTDFLLRKIINPICHAIAMSILLFVAIIYFVMPTLRDLVGNIVTTITICLIISQAADLVRIFTEFTSHVSFLVADTILYISLIGAFFWLNIMGMYIWKTFRSRNVFLRVTDGRKYCIYSCFVWTGTGIMAALAIFGHFFLDTKTSKKTNVIEDQETIGFLGLTLFFIPIALLTLLNLFYYITTLKIVNSINTYGRIHHKLKSNFTMFSLLFLTMTIAWLFLFISWLNYDALLYAHIIVNALQAPIILYICVLRQKHVTYLLKKSCCYNEPPSATDWGDEVTYTSGADY